MAGVTAVALLVVLSVSTAFAQTTTVTAAWDRNADAETTGYLVYYGTSPGNYQWSYDAGNQINTPLTLSRGSVYYVAVRAYNASAQVGPPSNEATIDLAAAAPTAPSAATNMVATVSGARATLSWRAPTTGAAPDRYLLYVGSSSGGTNLANGTVVGNVLTVSGDLPKGRYYARVRAANSFGASAESNQVFFKIGRSLVSPSGFAVQWVGTTAVLTWTAPSFDGAVEDRPTSYVIEAGTSPGATDVAVVSVGNVTTISADIPSGTYYVRVRAVNEHGDSEPTADLVLVAPGAPRAPTNLASPGSGSTVTLQWTAPSGPAPTGYVIEAGTAPGRSDLGVLQVGNVTSFTAPAPPPGTYYVRVRAINARGAGQPSNEVVVRR